VILKRKKPPSFKKDYAPLNIQKNTEASFLPLTTFANNFFQLTHKEHYKKNWAIAWPVMIGQIGHVMVGLADSIMIGGLGTVALAAGAFANSVFIVPMVFGIGMAYGLTTPIANADGEGAPLKARSFLKHGIYLNTFVAILMFLVLLAFQNLLPFMGQELAVLEKSKSYFTIICLSIIPLLGFLTFKQFAEGLSDTRVAMVISIAANLLNIFLNYLLIYGNHGFPELGLDGAGYATLIARVIMLISMAIYVFRKPAFKIYTAGIEWLKIEKEHFKILFNIGFPSGLQYIFEVSTFAMAAVMAGWINAESLAAHQIAISLASVSYMAASGFGAAANVRVSNLLGAGKIHSMRRAAHSNFILVLALMLVFGLIYLFGRFYFPSFYSNDPDVIALSAQLLIVAVAFQLFDGMQVTTLSALRGLSETQIPTLIVFISYWIIGFAACYTLGFTFGLGPLGIWIGLATALIIASIFLFWRFEYLVIQLLKNDKNGKD
jgi:MATE family multidrug resistance protein